MRIYWNGGAINAFGTRDLRDNQWHHLAFVRNVDDDTYKCYIDGALELSLTTAGPDLSYTVPHRIGADNRSPGIPYFHGAMDELRIWNTAKTANELFTLSRMALSGTENGLLHYFNFNEAVGGSLVDIAGLTNGTLTNMNTTDDWTQVDGSAACQVAAPSNRVKSPLTQMDVTKQDEIQLSIFPNPTQGNFTLDFGKITSLSVVSIRDYTGKLISRNTYSELQQVSLELNQAAGIYFIKVETEGKVQIAKIIKQ